MFGPPAYADDLPAGDADFNTAPNRADTARGRHPPFGSIRLVLLRKAP
jgi:hypothetical protein